MRKVEFFVGGMEPRPKGSYNAYVVNWPRSRDKLVLLCKSILGGRKFFPMTQVVPASKGMKAYEKAVNTKAQAAMIAEQGPMDSPVVVKMQFFLKRPQAHTGTGKNAGILKEWAERLLPTKTPDLDKLIRSTNDAMTGVVYKDDCQIIAILPTKRYGKTPGVKVEVAEMSMEMLAAFESITLESLVRPPEMKQQSFDM